MRSEAPEWSVVIPNFNGEKVIGPCLDSILECASKCVGHGEIIVVDDGSRDGSAERVLSYGDAVELIRMEKNEGFSSASNRGIFRARGKLVFLLNNDVQLRSNVFEGAARHFENGDVFAVSFRAIDENGRERIGRTLPKYVKGMLKCVPDEGPPNGGEAVESFFASGGGAAFNREKLTAMGGFDEAMNPFYWEDVDLSFRALKRGWRILFDPGCVIFHPSSGVISVNFNTRAKDIVARRNQILMFWKNIDSAGMWAGHAVFLAVKLITSLAMFRLDYPKSFVGAARGIGRVIRFRSGEKRFRMKTDKEILELYRKG